MTFTRSSIANTLTWFLCFSIPCAASAQGRQPFAIQASAFGTLVAANDANVAGLGIEPQLRMNRIASVGRSGVASMGIGGQYTRHLFEDGTLVASGLFVEPRIAFPTGSDKLFAYIGGRLATLRQSNPTSNSSSGFAAGGGGGVIRALGYRTNLDVGFALLYQHFEDARTPSGRLYRFTGTLGFAAKLGVSIGIGD